MLGLLTNRAALTILDNEMLGAFAQKIIFTYLLSLKRWTRVSRLDYVIADLYGGRFRPCSRSHGPARRVLRASRALRAGAPGAPFYVPFTAC